MTPVDKHSFVILERFFVVDFYDITDVFPDYDLIGSFSETLSEVSLLILAWWPCRPNLGVQYWAIRPCIILIPVSVTLIQIQSRRLRKYETEDYICFRLFLAILLVWISAIAFFAGPGTAVAHNPTADTHWPDVDFSRHYAEFGRRGKTRSTRCWPLFHLNGEVQDHFLSWRQLRPDVGPTASKDYLQSYFSL